MRPLPYRALLVAVAVVLLSLLLLLPRAPRAQASADAPDAVLALEPYRTRWALRAVVGGQPRRYLFDTGAGLSFVSPETARAAGCTPWGRLSGFNMFGTRIDAPRCDDVAFDAGGVRLRAPVAGVVAMAALSASDADLDGIVGLDLFAGRAITLDLARGRLVLESDASLAARTRGATPLPIRVNREVAGRALSVFAGVPSAQGTLWMELDSGNGGTVLVSRPVARALGLDSAVKERQTADFAVAAGVRVRTEHAYTPDMIMDGNLGMPFLRAWVVTLDLRAGRGWIAPAG
jgi:hypothetical protein